MNPRPSTSILALSLPQTGKASARSLRRLVVAGTGAAAMIILGLIAYAGIVVLKKSVAGDEDARILNAATLSKQLVERVLAERSRQVDLIASAPTVIGAAVKGGQVSRDKGLPKLSIDELEARFKATRSQQVDAETYAFLRDLLPKLDIAEVMVTDQYGYNAVTTSLSNDFVQSDEAWWTTAWTDGSTAASATQDKATGVTVVELAHAIHGGTSRVGVVKVKFGLATVDSVLTQGGSGQGSMRVDLVDTAGHIIASSVPATTRFGTLSGSPTSLPRTARVFTYDADSVPQRAAVVLANNGRWNVIAHMPEADARRGYYTAKWALLIGVGTMLLLTFGALLFFGRFIERRITGPAGKLAEVAEAVAAGDLSKQVTHMGADDEIGRLGAAIAAMIGELRRLASALNESAIETNSMTAEITASSEEMAASAGQIAHTASDLSMQANVMAENIQTLAGSSENLVKLAGDLDAGAQEGVQRNTHLRALALDNRSRLDDSARSLTALSGDVEASATAIEQLAEASEEVKSFVTLVQKLARQSKLLALNAAMEAARAGDHGHGFAVVAEEVRRLAAMSSDAAERTERVVNGVLKGIADSRSSSERTVETVREVRSATEQGSHSFGEIEKAVADAEMWTASIEKAVQAATALSRDMRVRLDTLAGGTESFAAAMEEVAASSQEQSASTEQIAAAAGTLAGAAERLTLLVANLRLEGGARQDTSRKSGPVRVPPEVAIGRVTRLTPRSAMAVIGE